MGLLHNISNLLASTDMVYTDILIQAQENLRVFSPSGWSDMGMPPLEREMVEFAKNLTKTSTDEDLYNLLREKGACNVGCMIGSKRVRVDVSLVSNPFRANSMTDPSHIDLQESVLELVVRRHREIIPIQKLKLPPKFLEYLNARSGLILLTGQTASGKTSTAASALDYINSNMSAHIITIEDPIEYIHRNDRSVFSPKEVGRDSPDIATATYDSLRQRPDVIFISELRNADAAKEALYASQSALVIATTHAPTLEEGLERILNFFPNEELAIYRALRSSLRCVIAQTLLPLRQNNQFMMFFEYIQGSNKTVQTVLSEGTGLERIREALNEQALKLVKAGEPRQMTGNPMDMPSTADDQRLTGLVPMNLELAKAVESGLVNLADAQRATPSSDNFAMVHGQLLQQLMKKRESNEARRVPPA